MPFLFQSLKSGIDAGECSKPTRGAKHVGNRGKMLREEAESHKARDGFGSFGQATHVVERFVLVYRIVNATLTRHRRKS